MKKKIYSSLVFISLLLISCGGGGDDSPEEPIQEEPIATPEAALLVFPENNTECNISEIVSETQSTVPFEWNASENTDTYRISVINLNTNMLVSSPIVNEPEANITLERGTPYEWFVVSEANDTNETATSATFRFFNEGPGIENYAPFPAIAINPNRGANLETSTRSVSLEWEGNDIDDDIVNFDVFFGTDNVPQNSLGVTNQNTIDVDVVSEQIYYWRIISIDNHGNSSESEIFTFRVN